MYVGIDIGRSAVKAVGPRPPGSDPPASDPADPPGAPSESPRPPRRPSSSKRPAAPGP